MTTLLTASQEFCTRLKLSGTGPTTVVGQVQEYSNAISALKKAHKEIVESHIDWAFLWGEGSVILGVGSNPNTPIQSNVRKYDETSFYYDGERLDVVPWSTYRKQKLSAAAQAETGPPRQVVIRPDDQVLVLPYPDEAHTVTFDYWATATELAVDSDVIQIPDHGIEALYDRAKMIWLGDEEAPNYLLAQADFEISYDSLEDSYWPGKDKSSMAEGQDIVVVAE